MLLAEEVEVGLADYLLRSAVWCDRGDPACAYEEEPAAHVLEVDALLGGGKQVAHAGELQVAHRFAFLQPFFVQLCLSHIDSCAGIDE